MKKLFASLLAVLPFTAFSAPAADHARHNTQQGTSHVTAQKSQENKLITTASGLQYRVDQEGTGASPKATDTVTVNYKGTFLDGKVFDQGKNISFPLNQVIAGWTEGVQLMKEGAKFHFVIPSELAYGARGAGAAIPPNTDLAFDVELVRVGR